MTAYTHVDGVAWDRAPLPPARHRCKGQSWAKLDNDMAFMVRCACGAAGIQRYAERVDWKGKNARRIDPLSNTHSTYRRPLWVALVKKVLG